MVVTSKFIYITSVTISKGSKNTMNNSNLLIQMEGEIKSRIKIQNGNAVINSIHLAEFLSMDFTTFGNSN